MTSIYLKMMSLGALKWLLAELLAEGSLRADEVAEEIKRRERAASGEPQDG